MNPLLEACGNAATSLNHNSSRFGKLITLHFTHDNPTLDSPITGGVLSSYLLEKVRVVRHAVGEGSFHIFTQMQNGLDASELCRLGLTTHAEAAAAARKIITNTAADKSASRSLVDAAAWRATNSAAASVGLQSEEMGRVCELLAACLHLNEIRFAEMHSRHSEKSRYTSHHMSAGDEGVATIATQSEQRLLAAAALLGVPADRLAAAVCTRSLRVSGSKLECGRNTSQARASCEALTKQLYSMLFEWVIQHVNSCIAPSSEEDTEDDRTIALLDLFGFENFEHNSFEQLCINYANESLQSQFNADVFAAAEAEAKAEGVHLGPADYADNAACVSLLSSIHPRPGILPLLNEECAIGDGTDAKFVIKLHQNHSNSTYLQIPSAASGPGAMRAARLQRRRHAIATRQPSMPSHASGARAAGGAPNGGRGNGGVSLSFPKEGLQRSSSHFSPHAFAVTHYAGEVWYDANGFRSKNLDVTDTQHYELLASADHPLLPAIIAANDNATASIEEDEALHHSVSMRNKSEDNAWKRAAKQMSAGRRAHAALMGSSTERRRPSKTIGGQFMRQLKQLASTLSASECQYVRCIKPNSQAIANKWEEGFVLRQLAQGGILEATRAHAAAFDHRLEHDFSA